MLWAYLCSVRVGKSAGVAEGEPLAQTLITDVAIFDGVSDGLSAGMNVLIEGNLIKTISAEAIEADGATVIEGGGRTLMPGLIDAHIHLLGIKSMNQVTWVID